MLRITLERDEFEERLGGNIPSGALIVIEGENGTGKSIVCERLAFGALESGHNATFVSSELTGPQFYAQMQSLAYPCVRHAIAGRLVFHHAPGTLDWPLLPRLLGTPNLFQRDIVFIDTFSWFLRDATDKGVRPDELAHQLTEALARLKQYNEAGTTAVLTIDPTEIDASLTQRLRSVADVLLAARTEVMGLTAVRTILIKRFNRCAKAIGDVLGYRVEPGAGLVVEIRSVS